MKCYAIVLLLAVLSLGGCAMIHTTPEPVVQGAELSAQMAEINRKNVRAVNDEYHRVLTTFMRVIFIKRQPPTVEECEKIVNKLHELHQRVAARFYRPADINAEISRALADYLKTPGISLEKIQTILQMIAAR